jgi:drug/metabolite transporter (DMT)-like permease
MTTLTALAIVPFETVVFNPTTHLLMSLLYMGICATVFTTYVQTRFQKDTTPTRAVIIFTIEPVIAAVLAYFFLGEILGTMGMFGAALIVGGILVSEFSDTVLKFIGMKTGIEER